MTSDLDALREQLRRLLEPDQVADTLYRGSPARDAIRALQILLFHQGLAAELNWQAMGADGIYGAATARAVQAFASHHGLLSNGQRVDRSILTVLLDTTSPVSAHPRRVLQPLLEAGRVERSLFRGSPDGEAIAALQDLLHELGYGEQLQWQRYGADGDYGAATTTAVAAAAADLGISSDGQWVSAECLRRLLEQDAVRGMLRALLSLDTVEQTLYRGSPAKEAIRALQIRLHGLGYGAELRWARYGADGDYGAATTTAVARFARDQGLSHDGQRLDSHLVERLLDSRRRPAGGTGSNASDGFSVVDLNARVRVGDGRLEHSFGKYRLGLYTRGANPPLAFIHQHRDLLGELGLTPSLINVMVAVAENEGNLDAINTWDNAFLSFGMLQWTAGTGNARGELAALLWRLEQQAPAVFQDHFGGAGLAVSGIQGNYGYLKLAGRTLDRGSAKERLRTPEWAFRFWRAGQDTTVQAVEVAHAASRLDTFYRHPSYRVEGHYIAELVNSEYGVALLFDQHVNRPGYLTGSLATALRRSGLGTPGAWDTTAELNFLTHYLAIRADYGRYPMTHAGKRAAVTRRYLDGGIISAERGSFQMPEGSLQGRGR